MGVVTLFSSALAVLGATGAASQHVQSVRIYFPAVVFCDHGLSCFDVWKRLVFFGYPRKLAPGFQVTTYSNNPALL